MGPPQKTSFSKVASSSTDDSWSNITKSVDEKGIYFNREDGVDDAYVARVIQYYQWDLFSQPTEVFYLDLVREFYQKLDPISYFSTVQGKK